MASQWFTAREIAGLPGMPSSKRRTNDKLKALAIESRQRTGRGGGLEYNSAQLPAETQAALAGQRIADAGEAALKAIEPVKPLVLDLPQAANEKILVPAVDTRKPPSETEQRCADARMQLLQMVDEYALVNGLKKSYQMVAAQVTLASKGDDLQQLASVANQRRSTLSARTLEAWAKVRREKGWHGLLPATVASQPLAAVGDDVAAVLGLYFSKEPMFRNLTDAVRTVKKRLNLAAEDGKALYSRCRRAIAKTDNIQGIKARHSGAQRAAMLPFKRRDTSALQPNDVWLMDGHTYKAKVRHPDHGQPFAPELTIAVDAATRKIMGWSVSLSENVIAVGDALRHGISQGGVPAILYSDNGAGETAKAMDCPIDGFCARLGIDHRTGLPGHPQGHGLIERSWRTHAIRSAKSFGSYQGKDVDVGSFRKAASRIAKEQRAIAAARNDGNVIVMDTNLLPTWEQFVQVIVDMVDDYNSNHRHRSLPKNADGKHMTPSEAWTAMVQPDDQHMLSELELRTMFRPSVLRTAKRGEVKFFNQVYAAPELMRRDIDGQQVSVRYDIHNASSVEVFTVSGEYVCQARWGANRMDYYPKPVIEMAREKRVRATVKRREQQIDTAIRELGTTVDANAHVFLPEPAAAHVLQPDLPSGAVAPSRSVTKSQVIDVKADEVPAGRPFFSTPSDRYEWLMANRTAWSSADHQWLANYTKGDDYAALAEYFSSRGTAWEEEEGNGFKGAQATGAAGA